LLVDGLHPKTEFQQSDISLDKSLKTRRRDMIKEIHLKKAELTALKIVALFSGTLFLKMMVLHRLMNLEQHFLRVSLVNLATLLAVLFFVVYLAPTKYFKIFLWIHLLMSLLIFINTVYYSHFFTLVPVHSIFQLGQLGGVTASIFALIRPLYLLFFADTGILWWTLGRRTGRPTQDLKRNRPYAVIALALIVGIIGSIQLLWDQTEGHLTPNNLGMLNYHIYDAVQLFRPRPIDTQRAEEAVTAITQEEEIRAYEGIIKDKNIIVIQAESLQSFVMEHNVNGQEVTPVINRLKEKDTLYFSRFYEQVGWGNTSDAEFISHNSFYPSVRSFSYREYENNTFYTLPMHLKKQGYTTMVLHGNDPDFWNRKTAYEGQGIDLFYSSEDFEMNEIIGMGLSDRELFRQSIEVLRQTEKPFYAMYVTLTSHHPFMMEEELQYLDMPEEYDETVLGHYLQSVHYMDREIGEFIELLKVEGLYDDSVIVIYGDHQGLDMRNEEANNLVSHFIDRPYEEDEMFRVPLLIHIPGSGLQEEIKTAGGQIDFFPTIANLTGDPIQANRVMGKDLLNIKNGFIAKQVHVSAGSFIDNEHIFIMSPDGLYENSRAWHLGTGEEVALELCRPGYERALAEISLSEYILQNDLVPDVQQVGLEGILDEIKTLLELETSS
jgi:lipoteichoic acid synthase